jgi:molecular chaperone HscC
VDTDTLIGIDLGTTNSVTAYLTADGPRLIPNALGEALTPSVVGLDPEGQLLVGRTAKELQVTHPDRCAALFKRHMGSDWTAELAGRKFTPEELSSLVLRSVKQDAEAHLGGPITRAVITVPAYFNDQQRKATINAGRIAGLKVERIFNEPTAAALAYGFHEARDEKVLLIFDLGGGTFDVSVVELFEGILEVRASSGESFLGGEDFTRTLAARILELQGYPFERTELEAPHLVSRMIQQCELAKCRLSRQEAAAVRIPDRGGTFQDGSPQVTVSREQFQKWTHHLLGRVELPIRRVLGDTGLQRSNVDEIILVGGATRMPVVVDLVTHLFGKPPQRRLNPDEVVALGAAVQAGLIAREESVKDLVVTDVAPFTLGIAITKQFGLERRSGYFLPIINRNTTIPVSRVNRVATVEPNQTEINVTIYQGESRRVENNLFLGEFTVRGIPRGPEGQEVDVRFTYDLNGVLEVEATVVETREKVSHVVTRYARGLSQEQVARALQHMQQLKTHPREETTNRFLIRRAERVFQELSLEEREVLGRRLDGFEAALEIQDADSIERHRQALQGFLDRHDMGFSGDAPEGDDHVSPVDRADPPVLDRAVGRDPLPPAEVAGRVRSVSARRHGQFDLRTTTSLRGVGSVWPAVVLLAGQSAAPGRGSPHRRRTPPPGGRFPRFPGPNYVFSPPKPAVGFLPAGSPRAGDPDSPGGRPAREPPLRGGVPVGAGDGRLAAAVRVAGAPLVLGLKPGSRAC